MNADAADSSSAIVGVWSLVALTSEDPDGKVDYPFGPHAQGRIVYRADERMEVQLMDSDRPPFTDEDPGLASAAEVRVAFDGYMAHYRTYEVDPREQVVVHNVEGALIPNWVGRSQVRHFELDGDRLTLKGPLRLDGVRYVVSLVWERAG